MALENIVEDLSPKLGGDLDFNSHSLVGGSYKQLEAATVLNAGTHTFQMDQGVMQQLTAPASGTITIAFSGFEVGKVQTFIIDAVSWGLVTIVFPVGTVFMNAVFPTFSDTGMDRVLAYKDMNDVFTISLLGFDIS